MKFEAECNADGLSFFKASSPSVLLESEEDDYE